jgi:hypothetical protein
MATVVTEPSHSDVYIAGAGPSDELKCNKLHVAINLLGFSCSYPPMPTTPNTLVELPKSLRKGIDRRLPRSNRFKDLSGKAFGKRVVMGFAGFRGRFAVWLCRCKCGRLNVVEGARLTRGDAGSCGCSKLLSQAAKELRPILNSLIARCHDPTNPMYGRYGAQGITVCKRWRESPEAFAADMGPRPSPKHVVVCRNGSGYGPANCYWELPVGEDGKIGHLITYKGKTQNLSQWAKQLRISRERMRQRVNKCQELGLPLSLAITRQSKRGRPRKSKRPTIARQK